jgi:phosphoheptose isomerase
MDQLDEPLQALFASHVDIVYRALDAMYPEIHRAVELLCDSLLADHRVLVCGSGIGTALGQAFCTSLLNRAQIDRPGLPVIAIGSDPATIAAVAESYGISEVHSRQIRALGQAGDALVLIAGSPSGAGLGPAVRAAHAREMRIIALTAGEGGEPAGALGPADIELRVVK